MAKKKASVAPRECDRKKLPLSVKQQLLMEAGYKCGKPSCQHVITLELHHIAYVSEGGGDDPSNLLVLCPYCHAMHHAGHIPVEAIRFWKGLLVALNQAFDRHGMELLLLLHKIESKQLWYSSDGVLKFAGLIGADLVAIAETDMIFMAPNEQRKFTQTSHRLALTSRGTHLIEAWLSGNETEYRKIISAENPDDAKLA